VSEPKWEAATFAGTAAAQADRIAALTPTQRVAILEQLLEIAQAGGALQRALEDKQRALDELWSPASTDT
jgi:uncharacterized tellurite resistance protein B-like protein